ncbi:Nascent polypeptide-associated complex subunit alpha-like UBA domain-containing protein [Plasmodiophora brassicae]|nr:hypothetical protein PBRA_003746 [Plasmodiophora brassicae]
MSDEKSPAAGGGVPGEKPTARGEERDERRDLERVTDFVEETEIDAPQVSSAITMIAEEEKRSQAAKVAREKELRMVKIDPAHVELIAQQMDIDQEKAERILREHGGDPVKALRTLIHVSQ